MYVCIFLKCNFVCFNIKMSIFHILYFPRKYVQVYINFKKLFHPTQIDLHHDDMITTSFISRDLPQTSSGDGGRGMRSDFNLLSRRLVETASLEAKASGVQGYHHPLSSMLSRWIFSPPFSFRLENIKENPTKT